jgi:hypothetical protein
MVSNLFLRKDPKKKDLVLETLCPSCVSIRPLVGRQGYCV